MRSERFRTFAPHDTGVPGRRMIPRAILLLEKRLSGDGERGERSTGLRLLERGILTNAANERDLIERTIIKRHD